MTEEWDGDDIRNESREPGGPPIRRTAPSRTKILAGAAVSTVVLAVVVLTGGFGAFASPLTSGPRARSQAVPTTFTTAPRSVDDSQSVATTNFNGDSVSTPTTAVVDEPTTTTTATPAPLVTATTTTPTTAYRRPATTTVIKRTTTTTRPVTTTVAPTTTAKPTTTTVKAPTTTVKSITTTAKPTTTTAKPKPTTTTTVKH